MTSSQTRSTTCHRCGGSGQVPFDFKGGRCFDCNGTGKVARISTRGKSPLGKARLTAEAALLSGDAEAVREALAGLVEHQLSWGSAHYTLHRQLVDFLN